MHNINTFEKVSQNFHYKNHTKAIFWILHHYTNCISEDENT
jgi:hypothetical protein